MFKLIFLSLLSFNSYAQDFGTGADGVCNLSGGPLKTTWNCTDITVTGTPTFNASASGIVIRATGDVVINGTLSASASSSTSLHFQINPLGGGAGGVCTGPAAGTCTSPATKASGSLGGEGTGGLTADDSGFAGACGGGGGAGGSYNNISLGSAGSSGTTSGGFAGAGAAQVTTSYGNETNFATTINGGVGGGAGGSGDDSSVFALGGFGGAGGGIIQIFAKGTITNNGTIRADGAKGNNGSVNGGAAGGSGGGGSGGSIFIYTASTFSNLNSISAQGGLLTAGSGNGGAGGAGGVGRIRIDTATGAFTNTGSVNPTPQVFVATVLPGSAETFTSDITYNCAFSTSDYMNFLMSFFFGLLMIQILSKFGKVVFYLNRSFK